MRRRLVSLAFLGALALPAAAQAQGAYFPGSPIDAPADLRTAGDLDLAPDGTGALAYVKQEGGEDRLYAARFSGGVFQAPERLDGSLGGNSAQPAVAAADGGRLIVAFVNKGVLHVVTRGAGARSYEAPRALAAGASTPTADLGVNGIGSVVWTQPGASAADVRAARQERVGGWAVLDRALDVDPARDAGAGTGPPRVAVAADGVAVAVWGEAERVYARKLFRGSYGAAQDLTLQRLGDAPGQGADLPDVDVEYDSSFAWVTFRQRFLDGAGRNRLVARRMRGTAFDDAVPVDGLQQGALGGATTPRVDLNGRGVGLLAGATDNGGQVLGTPIFRDQPRTTSALSPATGAPPQPVPAVSENNDGLVAWYQTGTVQARTYQAQEGQEAQPRETVTLSAGPAGLVDPARGLDASVDRAFGAVVVWAQGAAGAQTLMYGVHDRVPGSFSGRTSTGWIAPAELKWRQPFELWGPLTYQVLLDGQPLGAPVNQPRLALATPLPDGRHLWSVVASDIRGQTSTTPPRRLLVDGTPPGLRVGVTGTRRAGQRLTIRVRAKEVGRAGQASGLSFVRVSPGSGARPRSSRAARGKAFATKQFTVGHAYARGTRTLTVTAYDRAGNVAVRRIRLRIR
ncbi:MAG TPA: hypothetical protein VGV40_10255 [Solirubrobacteraceae bacterium]|nr:hypothetical protein [Solirubrobacteraceae bacterium]